MTCVLERPAPLVVPAPTPAVARRDGGARRDLRNGGLLLAHAMTRTAASQLCGAGVVLPVLLIAIGGSVAVAGFLRPLYALTTVAGALFAPSVVGRSGDIRRALMASMALTAAVIATVAVFSERAARAGRADVWCSVVMLGAALVLGVTQRSTLLLFAATLRRNVGAAAGRRILVWQSAAGGLGVAAVLLIIGIWTDVDAGAGYVPVLWVTAVLSLISSLSCLCLSATPGAPTSRSASVRALIARGREVARTSPWYRSMLQQQMCVAPVAASLVFYSIQGASRRGGAGLSVMVIAAALSSVVSAACSDRVVAALGVRGLARAAVGAGFGAAVLWALSGLATGSVCTLGEGAAVLSATAAVQAGGTARQLMLVGEAPVDEVLSLGSVCDAFSAVMSAVLSLFFGWLAMKPGHWPALVVVAFTVAGLIGARRVMGTRRVMGARRAPRSHPAAG